MNSALKGGMTMKLVSFAKQRIFYKLLPVLFLITAVTASCGGGGGGGGAPSTDTGNVGAGWVTIDYPTTESTYTTDRLSVYLSGKAFISPTWWHCCSGSAEDTGVTVTWENVTTGVTGNAYQQAEYCWFFGYFLCGIAGASPSPLPKAKRTVLRSRPLTLRGT